ncbi:MAG: hypothetical protein JNL11_11935 [Bdellovibrionaceae bacterium]|nr:hypothetical protein [Pseudobdellovibrionaceae bacterium]
MGSYCLNLKHLTATFVTTILFAGYAAEAAEGCYQFYQDRSGQFTRVSGLSREAQQHPAFRKGFPVAEEGWRQQQMMSGHDAPIPISIYSRSSSFLAGVNQAMILSSGIKLTADAISGLERLFLKTYVDYSSEPVLGQALSRYFHGSLRPLLETGDVRAVSEAIRDLDLETIELAQAVSNKDVQSAFSFNSTNRSGIKDGPSESQHPPKLRSYFYPGDWKVLGR